MKLKNILMTAMIASATLSTGAQNTDNLMTPEMLWSMHRLGGHTVNSDGTLVVYSLSTPDVKANKSHSVLNIMNSDGSNLRQLSAADAPNQSEPVFFGSAKQGTERIAYMQKGDVWSMKTDGTDIRQHTTTGDIEGFQISPDCKRIIVIREVPATSSIQPQEKDLPEATGMVIDDLNFKHWDQYVKTIPHIFLADFSVEGTIGELKDVLEGEPYECPVLPFGGTEQFCFSPDGTKIAYTSRKKVGVEYAKSTDTDIYLYDIESGETYNICKLQTAIPVPTSTKNPIDTNNGYDMDPQFSPDGTMIAWRSMEREGYESDFSRLCVFNLSEGSKTYVSRDFKSSGVENFCWNPNSKLLYFTAVDRACQKVFSVDLNGKLTTLADGQYDYASVQFVPTKNQLLLTRHSIKLPDDLYILSLGKKKTSPKQISELNRDILSTMASADVKERMVKTTDDKDMLCWVIYPPHFDPAKKYPTLLFCEGGPQSPVSQFWSYRWNFQIMAANDYIIIAPNRRGVPGFGMEWNEEISGDYSGQCMKDYLSAIDDICKEPYVDKNHLGCVGASFGGYSVYWLAGNHNKRFKAFIAHDGIFNFDQQYYETEEMWFPNWDLGGAPETHNLAYRTSPHLYVNRWDTPILCIHGGKDYRILDSQAQAAFSAARMHGIPAELLLFPDENHWVLKPQNGILWQRTFFRWLDKWLKPTQTLPKGGPSNVSDSKEKINN